MFFSCTSAFFGLSNDLTGGCVNLNFLKKVRHLPEWCLGIYRGSVEEVECHGQRERRFQQLNQGIDEKSCTFHLRLQLQTTCTALHKFI